MSAAAFVVVEERVRLAAQAREAARVGLARLLGAERLLLAGLELGFLDLARLELEHLAAALGLAQVRAQALETGLRGAQLAEDLPDLRGARAGEVVDEREVRGRIEQALRLVLAVHGRQVRRQVAQQAHGNDRAVGRRASLAVRLQLAPQHELVAVLRQRPLLEERARVLQLEDRLDHGALLARPDEVGRGSLAEHEAERVDQDRLAGARFAGQERQPLAELQLQRGNERDVVYFQQLKHAVGGRWQNITALDRL